MVAERWPGYEGFGDRLLGSRIRGDGSSAMGQKRSFLRRDMDSLDGDERGRSSEELSTLVEALERTSLASSSLLKPLLLLVFHGSKLTE